MIAPPDPVRLQVPAPAEAPSRPGFPFVAALAPVLVSGVLWLVTSSPYVLVFAFLGPVVAVAGLLDGRRHRRRETRRAAERLDRAVDRLVERAHEARERERARLSGLVPAVGEPPRWTPSSPPVVLAGRGVRPSGVELSGADEHDDERRTRLEELAEEFAHVTDAPLPRDPRDGIAVVGPPVAAAAVARGVLLQLAATCAPDTAIVTVPVEESWAGGLPHSIRTGPTGRATVVVDGTELRIAWSGTPAPGWAVVDVERDRPAAVSRAAAEAEARRLRASAEALGMLPADTVLPSRVELATLLDAAPAADGLVAPIGVGADGAVRVDLVADGPHAVIAGTTGAGKSELLVSWVLAIATGRSAAEVAFVLVDFKGGAAFAPLRDLPHVLGVLTDLDGPLADRGIESLRAELRRRERVLAEHAARDIADVPPGVLARLVVVVDEYAAVVDGRPEWHALFADLASRGRSLGIHLVLCTQRPSGVVRDAVLANVAIRIALRLGDRADAIAFLGSDAPAGLPPSPRGRAVVATGDGARRTVQLAIADAADVARAAGSGRAGAATPWCEPLPARLELARLPGARDGLVFGLVDEPEEQRQPAAVLHPADAPLLVLGARGSGKTTLLETLAASAGGGVRLPTDPVALWAVLAADAALESARFLALDDLDRTLERCPPEYRGELADLVRRAVDDATRRGATVALTAQHLSAAIQSIAVLAPSRLLLRSASREEHVLAGGEPRRFDPERRPGSGIWRSRELQVAISDGGALRSIPAPGPRRVVPRGELAIVTTRARDIARRLADAGCVVRRVGDPEELAVRSDAPLAHVGEPDAWQADWALLARARRDLPILVVECDAADLRAIARTRTVPPPIAAGECWLVEDGRVVRAVLELPTGSAD